MTNSDIEEVEQIKEIVMELDKYIDAMGNKPELQDVYGDTGELRDKIKSDLVSLKTDIRDLKRIDETDFYGTDPTLASQRRNVIKNIEKIKIDIEVDVYPKVEKITKDLLIKKDVLMPKVTETDKQDIIQKTNDLLYGANRAVSIVKKGISLVGALKTILIGFFLL